MLWLSEKVYRRYVETEDVNITAIQDLPNDTLFGTSVPVTGQALTRSLVGTFVNISQGCVLPTSHKGGVRKREEVNRTRKLCSGGKVEL